MELKARFTTHKATIEAIVRQERKKSESPIHLSYWHETAETGHMIVMGPAQSVMFLVGAVAANGEDGLVSVTPVG
jgi:hypothetical protein